MRGIACDQMREARWILRSSRRGRQPQARFAATHAGAIRDRQGAAVRLRDLAAEHETDPRPSRLRGEKRNEEIGGIGEAGSLVADRDLDDTVAARPADRDAA